MSAAGGGGVQITIGGNSGGLEAAVNAASASLSELAAALRAQMEQAQMAAEALGLVGAAAGESGVGMMGAAAGAEDYGGALTSTTEMLRMFQAQQAEANASTAEFHGAVTQLQAAGGPLGGLGNLLHSVGEPLQGLISGTQSFGSVAQDLVMGGLGALSGGLGMAADAAGQFLSQMWAMTGGMLAFQAFGWATQQVQALTQEMLTLNETMQSQYVGWAYLFGGQQTTGGGQGGPDYGASSQLMQWTATQSYNAPFTRQDMAQAISTLQTVGLSTSDIEHFLPILEDLAVRNPGLSLGQIAQSVMGAQFGYTRMLRYDLRIAPQELEKYGLNMVDGTRIDPSTLLPALENYARDQGYYNPTGPGGQDLGASYMLAHNTFQGAWTSWQDRYQNALLELGGTYWNDQTAADATPGGVMVRNPTYDPNSKNAADRVEYIHRALAQAGDVREGSLFDDLITGLNAITSWWDQHQMDINKLVDLFQTGLGQGLAVAKEALQSFVDGLQQSGIGDNLLGGIKDVIAWLSDPSNQRGIRDLASAVGIDLGVALKDAGQDWNTFSSAIKGLLSSAGLGDLVKDFLTVGLALNEVNLVIEQGVIKWALIARVAVDAMKAIWDAEQGNYAAAQADLGDITQAYADAQQQTAQANQQAAQAYDQLTQAYAQYMIQQNDLARQQRVAAQAAADASSPRAGQKTPGNAAASSAGAPGPGAGGGASTPPNAPSPNNTAAPGRQTPGVGGGEYGYATTSYGDTTVNNYIYGADAATVQAIVNANMQKQTINAALVAKRPGIGRYRMTGLIY